MAVDLGTGDSISAGRITETESAGNFTYSFWARRIGGNNKVINIGKGPNYTNDEFIALFHTDAALYLQNRPAYNTYSGITPTKLQHFFVVWDGSQGTNADRMKLWVDGVFKSPTGTNGTFAATSPSNTNNWQIGIRASTGGSSSGEVAEFKVWSNSLGESEAKSDYVGVVPSRDTLVCWRPLGWADPDPDYSGQSVDGTVTGTPTLVDGPPIASSFGFDEDITYTVSPAPTGHGLLLATQRNQLVF